MAISSPITTKILLTKSRNYTSDRNIINRKVIVESHRCDIINHRRYQHQINDSHGSNVGRNIRTKAEMSPTGPWKEDDNRKINLAQEMIIAKLMQIQIIVTSTNKTE